MTRAFHVTCVPPAVGLYELSDGRFQLTKEGPVSPFMDGWQYLIVEEPLARFLEELGVARLRYASVEIFNRATGEQFHNL